jgi:four helix bundle protein
MLGESNNLYSKAFKFAVRVVKACECIADNRREFILSKQLLKAGTSIGANIAEANGAISKSDFSNKVSISYKESLETKYWLSLMKEARLIDSKIYDSLFADADELSKILFAILKTTRLQNKSSVPHKLFADHQKQKLFIAN